MSYILSALRKADQDRKKGKMPDILQSEMETETGGSVGSDGNMRVYWISGIVFLVVLNLWFMDWFQDKGVSGTPADSKTVIVTPRDQRAVAGMEKLTPSRTSVQPMLQDTPQQAPDTQRHRDPDTQSAKDMVKQQLLMSGKVPAYQQLPAAFRDALPELQLSGHLFSLAHPQARKVIINGKALREGDYIGDGLSIKEITVDGVVLDYEGTFFSLGAHQMFR